MGNGKSQMAEIGQLNQLHAKRQQNLKLATKFAIVLQSFLQSRNHASIQGIVILEKPRISGAASIPWSIIWKSLKFDLKVTKKNRKKQKGPATSHSRDTQRICYSANWWPHHLFKVLLAPRSIVHPQNQTFCWSMSYVCQKNVHRDVLDQALYHICMHINCCKRRNPQRTYR